MRVIDRLDLDPVRWFSRTSARVDRADRLQALLIEAAARLGFSYVALADHGDLGARAPAALRLTNYPQDWQDRFIRDQLYRIDPVQQAARSRLMGFRWSRLGDLVDLTPQQSEVMDNSRRYGFGDGFTVPLHLPGQRAASCSFAVERGGAFPTAQLASAQLLGQAAFEAARAALGRRRPGPRLSPRQRECVALLAAGLTDRGIARRLALSEETVTKYLNAARRRYGLGRRAQLVAAALRDGEIGFDDIGALAP